MLYFLLFTFVLLCKRPTFLYSKEDTESYDQMYSESLITIHGNAISPLSRSLFHFRLRQKSFRESWRAHVGSRFPQDVASPSGIDTYHIPYLFFLVIFLCFSPPKFLFIKKIKIKVRLRFSNNIFHLLLSKIFIFLKILMIS